MGAAVQKGDCVVAVACYRVSHNISCGEGIFQPADRDLLQKQTALRGALLSKAAAARENWKHCALVYFQPSVYLITSVSQPSANVHVQTNAC